MNYFPLLRPASFRGFAFGIPQDTVTQGRRIATHQYPGKDEPYHEEMGLDVRQISVEAVIAGPEFITASDQFEAILCKQGAGVLVHPYYGSIEVIMMSYTRTNSYDALGEVNFSITFEKFGKLLYPKALANTARGLNQSAESAQSALGAEFSNVFRTRSMPGFVLLDALDRASQFTASIETIFKATQSPVKWALNDLSGFSSKAFSLFNTLTRLIKPSRKTAVIRELSIAPLSLASTSGLTALQSVRGQNAAAIEMLMRGGSLSSAISLASTANYESRGEAIAIKDSLSRALESVGQTMADQGWDESWKSMSSMQSALSRDINERLGRLPYTIKLRSSTQRSSLALANMIYGDDPAQIISKADDVIARNAVRNPAVLPAGSVLEVLVNAA